MRAPENIKQISESKPDYMGFIFQPESSRYVGEEPDPSIFGQVSPSITKVGVFVNEDQEKLIRLCQRYRLQAAQLHGNETPACCKAVRENGIMVIKVFSLHDDFDFSLLDRYVPVVDYFLFDTKGHLRGGTGTKFNWVILDRYRLSTPFFLSGGIKPGDAAELKKITYRQLFVVDINSGFETSPAIKDAGLVKKFIEEVRQNADN